MNLGNEPVFETNHQHEHQMEALCKVQSALNCPKKGPKMIDLHSERHAGVLLGEDGIGRVRRAVGRDERPEVHDDIDDVTDDDADDDDVSGVGDDGVDDDNDGIEEAD